ncbi:MAG: YfcE family phosphodiesterase [Lachnospiraceae bacterium]|nr:YfcE family phosphodiesterase [Lachnospiraceae bacterium]
MKILIVSDTHGKHEYLEAVLEQEKPLDMLIHLGDVDNGGDYIEVIAECPVEMIAGNNDFFSDLPGEREFNIGKYRVMLTHGHYYYVNAGTTHIKREAVARNIDIAMFGHTHRPFLEQDEHGVVLNPGSIAYPRQDGKRPSYIIMDLDEEGEAHFSIEYL